MPSPQQLDTLWNASDDTLYPEAVKLLHRLIEEEGCMPLPASQMAGLLNVANASSYPEIERFMRHQRERNWSLQQASDYVGVLDSHVYYKILGELGRGET